MKLRTRQCADEDIVVDLAPIAQATCELGGRLPVDCDHVQCAIQYKAAPNSSGRG